MRLAIILAFMTLFCAAGCSSGSSSAAEKPLPAGRIPLDSGG